MMTSDLSAVNTELSSDPSESDLDIAIARATESLLAKQAEGGWWVGELQGDSILEIGIHPAQMDSGSGRRGGSG